MVVRLDPEPLPERRAAQPLGAVPPLWPAERLIQRLQHLPVRHQYGPRIDDRHRGGVRRAGGDSGRQRTAEPDRDRLAVVVSTVLDRRDQESPRAGGSRDGDALRHPCIVLAGRPAARRHPQGDRRRQGRTVGLIDQAHRHFDALALPHHVARLGKSNPQRPVAGDFRGTEIGNRGQPCLELVTSWYAYVGVRDAKKLEFRQLHQLQWYLAVQSVAAERQPLEVGEGAQYRRDHPAQLVAPEIQRLEVGQGAQFRRDLPNQLVDREKQPFEVGEPAQFRRDRPAQIVDPEIQPLEVGEIGQFRRDRPAQIIAPEKQVFEVGEGAQFRRDRPAQLVARERQLLEVGEDGQFRRDHPAQLVDRELQLLEVVEVGQYRRDRPAQLVVPEIQLLEVGEGTQFRRDRPAQIVAPEIQLFEVGEGAQYRRDRPAQLVFPEIQPFEVGEGTQFRRDRPAQLVVPEIQLFEV